MAEAKRAGFGGGVVVDYPESKKAKKYYLCLVAGSSSATTFSSEGLCRTESTKQQRRVKTKETRKEFIIRKKELYRKRGKEGVPYDSKYSGRKRRAQF